MNAKRTATRPCPVCGKTQVEVLLPMHYYATLEGSSLPENQDIVCCLHCGAVYTDTSGTQADYDAYYSNASGYVNPEGIGSGVHDADRLGETALWLKERFNAKSTRIADIGCTNGGLLALLSQYGFSSLTGIDPAIDCVERLKTKGFIAHQGHLGKLPKNCGPYDLVILSHVLEHVLDVTAALSSVKDILSQNGQIYIEVPDASRYIETTDSTPFQFFHCEHINHFDLSSLTTIAETHGFDVDDIVRKTIVFPTSRDFAIGVLLRRHEQAGCPGSSGQNKNTSRVQLKETVLAYIQASQRNQEKQDSFWRVLVSDQRPIVLWGAGARTGRLLSNPVFRQSNIMAVIDRAPDKQGKSVAGYVVQKPEDGLRHCPKDTLVVISAMFFANDIIRDLAEINADLPYFVP